MGRSAMRVLVAVGVITVGGLAWVDLVGAATKEITATSDPAKCDKQWGPPCYTPSNGTITPVAVGDTVTWKVSDGKHTVTPVDPKAFGGSGDMTGPDGTFSVTFDQPGTYAFYCKYHGSVEDDGKTHHGMWGKIDVKGQATSTSATTPTTAAPPPQPGEPQPKPQPGEPQPRPQPAPPPPAPAPSPTSTAPPQHGNEGSGETAAGTGRKFVGPQPPPPAPPPTRTAAAEPHEPAPPPPTTAQKPPRSDSRSDDDEELSAAGVTAVPPDEAVLPSTPQFPTPTPETAEATIPEAAPHGDTVAILKSESGGHRRKVILIGTMVGVGAFVLGVGGWKWANRPSKYWPA